ncbi:hypothetical protein BDL97_15G031200 [Sphagnum fallax]|nr:hypothetical protein BDL97_15G031200 [Sphagnum fallax]
MQAYMKSRDDKTWSVGSKKLPKAAKPKIAVPTNAPPVGDATPPSIPMNKGSAAKAGVPQSANTGKFKGRRGGKGVSLAEAAEALFSRGAPCTCQASRHKLINNCLGCGKIICEQEGEGPCNFCGTLVLREGSEYAGLEHASVPPANEAEASAQALKDQLVEFDRTATQRTTVIDDQSDYFEIDGNTWLSEKEKQLLRQRQEEEEQAEEQRRKRVVVTIDLLGRKVIMANTGEDKENGFHESLILAGDPVKNERSTSYRIKPNPVVTHIPVYVESEGLGSGDVKNRIKKTGKYLQGMVLAKTGRVQHDDPVVEAVMGQTLGHIQVEGGHRESNEGWHGLEVKQVQGLENKDNMEAREMTGQPRSVSRISSPMEVESNAVSQPLFDLCPHQTQQVDGRKGPVVLVPSPLTLKQSEHSRARIWSNTVLIPGMVLLKGWLSLDNQVEIVRECQTLGIGPGGFYQPSFSDGRHMHLQMMCLGIKHWEPTSSSYVSNRARHDNALPPPIPPRFLAHVKDALQKAQHVAKDAGGLRLGRSQAEGELPDMTATVCIVNFYEHSGALGMHQDKDESAESLQRGAPVVSFSVGDSAEFCYGKERELTKAEKVILDSGDVLIFGGPSRMLFHGVTRIIPKSAPKELLERTNLRPGRLNLTFREL